MGRVLLTQVVDESPLMECKGPQWPYKESTLAYSKKSKETRFGANPRNQGYGGQYCRGEIESVERSGLGGSTF